MDCNKKIAEYLKEHGISQKFLVEKTGLTSQKVSNIVNGTRKITGDELVVISKSLGLTLEFFLD